jgi:hypothetical protein
MAAKSDLAKKLKSKVQKQHKQEMKEAQRGAYEHQMRRMGKKVKPHSTPGRGKRIMTKYKTHKVAKNYFNDAKA